MNCTGYLKHIHFARQYILKGLVQEVCKAGSYVTLTGYDFFAVQDLKMALKKANILQHTKSFFV